MKASHRVHASVYKIPELSMVKAHLIVVVDDMGKLVETLSGPENIGLLVRRFTQKFAREVVKECVADTFDIEVDADSIELMPYGRLGKMLFKLENK